MQAEKAISVADILEHAEPFVDFDIQAAKKKYFAEGLAVKFRADVQGYLGADTDEKIVSLLAEMMSEIHVLKAAYIDQCRYKEPSFAVTPPPGREDSLKTEARISFLGDITGFNWYYAEANGRWAGPENESSLFVPRLVPGSYALEIHVGGEIEAGIVDSMSVLVDKEPVSLSRDQSTFPCVLRGKVRLAESRLPFHALKFQFSTLRSPSDWGEADIRRLAVLVSAVGLSREKQEDTVEETKADIERALS